MSTQTERAPAISQEDIHALSMESAQTAPGIVPFMEDEMERFDDAVDSFKAGEQENAQFTPFRLRQGVYGQRQADVQMIRVKIPGGILTPEALDALGAVSEKYAPLKKGHVTTRENIQDRKSTRLNSSH